MTPREARLCRLASLRERQHDAAALQLRIRRGQLAAAEAARSEAQDCVRGAQLARIAASACGDTESWLLASAEAEVFALSAASHQAMAAGASAAAQQAARDEADARRECKQMEATLDTVRRAVAERSARTEQHTLDEIARLQHAASADHILRRRGF